MYLRNSFVKIVAVLGSLSLVFFEVYVGKNKVLLYTFSAAFLVSVIILIIDFIFYLKERDIDYSRGEPEHREYVFAQPAIKYLEGDFVVPVENKIVITDDFYNRIEEGEQFQFDFRFVLGLFEKTPYISIIDKGNETAFRLDNLENEDFSDKFLCVKGRGMYRDRVATLNFEGVVIQSPENASDALFSLLDTIVYRFETYFVDCENDEETRKAKESLKGLDVDYKGLRFKGYITPANYRCVAICPECNKSFVFHTLNYHMADTEPVYSDDGQYTAKLATPPKDKINWSLTFDGKTYRYYNSFCCPHCGAPYIDYNNHHDLKQSDNVGCVHLGSRDILLSALSELNLEEPDRFAPDIMMMVDNIIDE